MIQDLMKPTAVEFDERLVVEIERAFCEAGGQFRAHIHRRYRGDTCPACATVASLALSAWELDAVRGAGADIAAKVNEALEKMRSDDEA